MNCNTFPVDKLLSDALCTLDQLDPGAEFVVQDLVPPAIWRKFPTAPILGNLGIAFSEAVQSRPDVCVIKTRAESQTGQTVYLKTA